MPHYRDRYFLELAAERYLDAWLGVGLRHSRADLEGGHIYIYIYTHTHAYTVHIHICVYICTQAHRSGLGWHPGGL